MCLENLKEYILTPATVVFDTSLKIPKEVEYAGLSIEKVVGTH